MNIQVRHYDRIFLVNIDGTLTEPDLVQFAGFVNSVASKVTSVVVDIHRAKYEPAVAATLFRLKKQYEKSKIRFLLVSPNLVGADSGSLSGAVDLIKTSESERVIEIFAQDAELLRVQTEIGKARAALKSVLGLVEASDAGLSQATSALEDKNKLLLQLFKTLASEIHHLQGSGAKLTMPGADNPTAVKVAETKRRSLDGIKNAKVLE